MAYLDKRWVGVFNYRFRRRFRHNLDKLAAAVDYILAVRPDAVVCTGDLTSSGQPGEFSKVYDILKKLVASGIPFFYLPGNHDCYVRRPKCVKAVHDMVATLSGGRDDFADFPLIRQVGKSELFLLNTSRPSNLLCSWGCLSKADSEALEKWCALPHDRVRILLSHYPLTESHPILRFRHRLYGQKNALRLLENGDIDLMLCGHVHRPYLKVDSDGRGECCAGSVTRNGSMVEIDCDEENRHFTFKTVTV